MSGVQLAAHSIIMSGSIKGSLENVVKGKLVLKGGKGVGGGVAAASSRSKPSGISKDISEAPKLESAGPKVYDTRTPYEKVRHMHRHKVVFVQSIKAPFQKVAEARSKRELEQLRSVSSKSHKQRLEVRRIGLNHALVHLIVLIPHLSGIQCQIVLAS